MSILIDYNQVFLANIFAQKQRNINENLVRHTVLSCTLAYKRMFSKQFGEVIFCADGAGHYWRKDLYKYYKANRKKNREQSGIDWQSIFDSLNKIREEIRENLPYKLIQVPAVEADDVIATIVKRSNEPILILSGDQDFIQLHTFPGVKQYSPVQKKYVRHDNPGLYLKEKILRGDSGDGIPNFLSDDDSFVNPEKRQKPLREAVVQSYVNKPQEDFEDELRKNYSRNEKLINLLTCIPEDVENKILVEFNNKPPTKSKMMMYFMKNGLKHLMSEITEF